MGEVYIFLVNSKSLFPVELRCLKITKELRKSGEIINKHMFEGCEVNRHKSPVDQAMNHNNKRV